MTERVDLLWRNFFIKKIEKSANPKSTIFEPHLDNVLEVILVDGFKFLVFLLFYKTYR